MADLLYRKCRKYRTLPFYRAPPFSSTTTEFFYSRFTELFALFPHIPAFISLNQRICTVLLIKSITYFLIHAPFCSLFLNQFAHQSILENLYCATYKKCYLLPHSCTSLLTSSVVEMVFVMFSNNAQCKKLVLCACAVFATFTVFIQIKLKIIYHVYLT